MTLDINKLILTAEEITTDPHLGFASEIQKPVHEIQVGDDIYILSVVMTLKN